MELRDSPAEAVFRATLRAWLHEMVPGDPTRWRDRAFVREYTAALYAAGYAGLGWPVEFGGGGKPVSYQAIFLEESARRHAAEHAGVIGVGMVGPTIIAWGTPEQRARFLPGILRGDVVFCQGFSESEAGSDLAAIRTTARLDGDGCVLNGHKLWSSYAPVADHCMVLARTDETATRHRGLTCLLVDLRLPGVTVSPIRQITGDADFAELRFDHVRLPADAVLGPVDGGWRVAMTTLAHERGTFGCTLVARLETAFARLRAMIDADAGPAVRAELADIWVELTGLRWTNLRALGTLARDGEPGPETGVIKLRWSHAAQRLAALGSLVADTEADLAFWHRELLHSRGDTIAGGTSEVLRDVIADRVLGLPRSR